MRVATYKATGLVGGDTITVTGNAKTCHWHGFYTDEFDIDSATNSSGVRPGSQSTTTTGAVTPASGQKVLVVAAERTTLDGTTVSSVVSSGAETVTQIVYREDAASTDTSIYYGTFVASAAASRTVTITYSGGSGNGYASLIKLLDPPAPAGAPISYVDTGPVLADGEAFYVSDVDTLTPLEEVRPLPAGYASVTAMLAQPTFYMAHRGGSSDWPEMSLHAYTQAAFWGVGCLEVSVQRSLDGIFVGIHDSTLDRTSGTTGFNVADHTFAEIQAHDIAPPSGHSGDPHQPYIRLEQLLDLYGQTHVIFIDPKNINTAGRAALLDLLDTYENSTDRFVAKYFGVTTAWPTEARARGYKTWGYFYEADLASVATYEPLWDILGMEHAASGGTWTTMLGYGKPVIAHVITSSAEATSALSKGADGLQVGAVTEVITRSA
jgi:hypothetical protein